MKFEDPTFIYWAVEREKARRNREEFKSPPPWSPDKILQEHRFCNVSREDDRTTRWIKANIRDPLNKSADDLTLFQAIALARFINLPTTLAELVENGSIGPQGVNMGKVAETVRDLQARGRTAFSGAYMVRAEKTKNGELYGGGKIGYLCRLVEGTHLPDMSSREMFVETLSEQHGYGTFMSGQIAADLAYTRLLEDAPDHMTWAPLGPGAVRGMNLALGRWAEQSIDPHEYIDVGIKQMEALPKDLVEDRKLTLHDVASNVNCETYKYLRIKSGGTGRKLK